MAEPRNTQSGEQTTVTVDVMLKLVNEMNAASDKRMLDFVRELKKPTAAEQKQMDLDAAKLRQRVENAAKQAMIEEQARDNAAKYCPHGTTHHATRMFTHQFRAQVMTPAGEKPYYIPRCTQCGSTWDRVYGLPSPKLLASQEQLKEGINLHEWSVDDIKRVIEWAKANPHPDVMAAA